MLNKKKLIALAIVLPAIMLARSSEYGISYKNIELINQVNDFRLKPYSIEHQKKALSLFENDIDYTKSAKTINLLKVLYINADDNEIKAEVIKKIDEPEFKDGKKKQSKSRHLQRYKKVKDSSESSFVHLMFMDHLSDVDEGLKNKIFNSRNSSIENNFYKLRYFLENGNIQEAREIFASKSVNKDIEFFNKMNRKNAPYLKENEITFLKIFALAGVFADKEEDQEKIQQVFKMFPEVKLLNIYYDYKYNLKKENYKKAMYLASKLIDEDKDAAYNNQTYKWMIEAGLKSATKAFSNKNFAESWGSSKSVLEIVSQIKNKDSYSLEILRAKKILKESSLKYIDELINKGEYAHSKRVHNKTVQLLKIRAYSY